MKGLIGIICAVGGGWIFFWAIQKAIAGYDIYNLIAIAALLISVFGIVLFLTRIKKWMSS
ncbi:hypothetical protein ACFLXO_08475 [Chloroflexota bacterium]